MDNTVQWGDPDDYIVFDKLLSEKSMFLIDARSAYDPTVVYRSRDNIIEQVAVKRHRPNQWQPEFKIFIEGDYWGSLNGKLFDDIDELAKALVKRGLAQVEF